MTRGGALIPDTRRVIGVVDLGKSFCRFRVFEDGYTAEPAFEATADGAPGLAEHRGLAVATDAVQKVIAGWLIRRSDRLTGLIVGAAGTEAAPNTGRELAERLQRAVGCPVAVGSDVTIAHAGAFAGSPGTVLVAGTGAVALGLDRSGRFRQADGWGPWLGDAGGGRWIGQQGLQAALRFADGRGPVTTLLDAMQSLIGSPWDAPGWVARTDSPARTLATFAQVVVHHAENDAVAAAIVSRAVSDLTATAQAAAADAGPVVVIGGLVGNPLFARQLDDSIRAAGLIVAQSKGNALQGAHLIADRTDLPYESKVFRGR